MGFSEKEIDTKCKELLQAWDKHAHPVEDLELPDGAEGPDVEEAEAEDEEDTKVVQRKTYVDLLRQDRRAAYERGTRQEVDDNTGMPIGATTTLYCGTWQTWWNEVASAEHAPQVLLAHSFDVIHIDPMYALGEQPCAAEFDTMRRLIEYFASDKCVVRLSEPNRT